MGNRVSSWFCDYKVEYGCVAQTNYGQIRGKTFCFKEGKVNCFLGVPFAKNGTYQERFQVKIFIFNQFLIFRNLKNLQNGMEFTIVQHLEREVFNQICFGICT